MNVQPSARTAPKSESAGRWPPFGHRVLWQLHRIDFLAKPVLISVCLIASVLAGYFVFQARCATEQMEVVAQEIEHLRGELARLVPEHDASPDALIASIFHADGDENDVIAAIYAMCAKRQVNVLRGGSSQRSVVDGRVTAHGMALELAGRYEDVLGALSDALKAYPTLALEEIAMHGRDGMPNQLEVSLKFGWFAMRSGEALAP